MENLPPPPPAKDDLVKSTAFAAYMPPFQKIREQIGIKLIFESERKKMYLVLVIVGKSKWEGLERSQRRLMTGKQ